MRPRRRRAAPPVGAGNALGSRVAPHPFRSGDMPYTCPYARRSCAADSTSSELSYPETCDAEKPGEGEVIGSVVPALTSASSLPSQSVLGSLLTCLPFQYLEQRCSGSSDSIWRMTSGCVSPKYSGPAIAVFGGGGSGSPASLLHPPFCPSAMRLYSRRVPKALPGQQHTVARAFTILMLCRCNALGTPFGLKLCVGAGQRCIPGARW
jgi:hypothetical protein